MAAGKVMSTGREAHATHYVIIPEDPEDGPELTHPESCQWLSNDNNEWFPQKDCQEEFEAVNCGLSYFFDHVANKPATGYDYTEYLEPGVYPVEAWSDSYYSWSAYGMEYESGIRLVDND